MRLVLVALLASCGGEAAPPPPVAAPAVIGLPPDSALGVLAIAPVPNRDHETWVPVGKTPFLIDDVLRAGATPSWVAIDSAGAQTRLTYGKPAEVPYGCDGNHMTVTLLDGDRSKLRSGLLWLRPLEHLDWAPKPVAITNGAKVTAARRDFTIGSVALEVVRTEPKRGVVNVVWRGKLVHQMTVERTDMSGADNASPLDFVNGGPGVPMPEAAWSFGDDRALVIVFRVQSYEGLGFKTLVVNAEAGRTVEAMGLYLYRCAF